jgi:hypothetical protein
MLQGAIIGQQQQAFAVTVQPAGGIDAGNINVVTQGAPALLITELAQDTERLIESKQHDIPATGLTQSASPSVTACSNAGHQVLER